MQPYYFGSIKSLISAFGKMFSDIKIQRFDSAGNLSKTIAVPIAYSNKQKWLTRVEQDPNQNNYTLTTMPRFGFEINSYTYDSTRKANKNTKVKKMLNDTMANFQYTPVPYNIGISLYLQTKNIEDGLMVMEQILPFFTPNYTISINAVPELDLVNDVPITLENVSVEDDYESDMITRRSIIHTFEFTAKMNLFGDVKTTGVIKQVHANLQNQGIGYFVAADKPEDVPDNFTHDEWISL